MIPRRKQTTNVTLTVSAILTVIGGVSSVNVAAFCSPSDRMVFRQQDSILTTPTTSIPNPKMTNAMTIRSLTTALMSTPKKDRTRYSLGVSYGEFDEDDWRYLRARFILREQMERELRGITETTSTPPTPTGTTEKPKLQSSSVSASASASLSSKNENDTTHRSTVTPPSRLKQGQIGQIGEFFSDTISTLLSHVGKSNRKKKGNTNNKMIKTTTEMSPASTGVLDLVEHKQQPATTLFDEDEYIIPMNENDFPEDFFMPVTEPFCLPKINLSRHRWAHIVPNPEPGSVLLASEKLGSSFRRSVILVTDHTKKAGSLGIVINRPMDGNLFEIVSDNKCNVDLSLKHAFKNSKVSYGGPVGPEDFTVLHGFGEVEGSKMVVPGVYVGGAEALMNEVRYGAMQQSDALFVKGYAAWVPNQLESEISRGVWYVASVSSDFILRYAGAPIYEDDNEQDLWSDILSCLGGQYEEIAKKFGSDKKLNP